MRIKNKVIASVAGIALSAVLLSGCGGKQDNAINIGYFNIGIIYYFIYAIYANIKEKYLFNNVI